MKKISSILLFVNWLLHATAKEGEMQTFLSDHSFIQYTGRIDFTNPKLPRFWQPGVYISFRFKGDACELLLNDEMLWGSNHNYIELVVDGKAIRLQTKTKSDTLSVTPYLSKAKEHTVIICKNTEANIGYMELAGIRCEELLQPLPKPQRKIECIGNSITCGTGSDASSIPCGQGKWQDQHNAWFSYGAVMARDLNAQFHLSSVSGIGLMRSCCNMNITMPQVFDNVSMRNDSIQWDFTNYQPDVVTVCLGQNDGIQDSAKFCLNYISFIQQLRGYYPNAQIILLSSPMADAGLKTFMKKTLTAVMKKVNKEGDKKVATFFFSKQYNSGCNDHPDLAEHQQIARELTTAVKKIMKW
jgi:lysophospholipase L1-like esterase